jgi:hypothetical protein
VYLPWWAPVFTILKVIYNYISVVVKCRATRKQSVFDINNQSPRRNYHSIVKLTIQDGHCKNYAFNIRNDNK